MATANLSVGINTTKAKSDLQELKQWMANSLTDMTLSINEKSLENSISRAMKGPSGQGYSLKINLTELKTDVSRALNDAVSGAKIGGGSIDTTQLLAEFKKLGQVLETNFADAGDKAGHKFTKGIVDDFGKLGSAHETAKGKTKQHTEEVKEHNKQQALLHSTLRGVAGGLDNLWLTYGRFVPYMIGAYAAISVARKSLEEGIQFDYSAHFIAALGGFEGSVNRVKDSLLGIKDAPANVNELANAMRVLQQTGIEASYGVSLLPTVISAATLGETDMKTATEDLVGVLEVFNLHSQDPEILAENFRKAGDVMAFAAQETKANLHQVAQSLQNVTGVAEQYKISLETVTAAQIMLGKQGIVGPRAGTYTRSMFESIYVPISKKAEEIHKLLDFSAFDAKTGEVRKDLEVIVELVGKLQKYDPQSQARLVEGMTNTWGAKQLRAILNDLPGFLKLQAEAGEQSGRLQKQTEKLTESVAYQLKQLKADYDNLLTSAFTNNEGLAAPIEKLREALARPETLALLTDLVTGIVNLGTALVNLGGPIADVAKALATLAVFKVVQAGAVALVGSLVSLGGAIGTVANLVMGGGTLAGGLTALASGPFAVLMGALAAAGAAWYMFRDRARDAMVEIESDTMSMAVRVSETLAKVMRNYGEMSAAAIKSEVMSAESNVDQLNRKAEAAAKLMKKYNINSALEASRFIETSTTTNSTGEVYTKDGNAYEAAAAYLNTLKETREAVDSLSQVRALAANKQAEEDTAAAAAAKRRESELKGLLKWAPEVKGAADKAAKELLQIEQTELDSLKAYSKTRIDLVKDEMQQRIVTEEDGWGEIKKIYAEAAEAQAALLASSLAKARKPAEKAKIIKEIKDVAEAYARGLGDVTTAFSKLRDEEAKATQEYMKTLGGETDELLKKAKAAEEENAQIGMTAAQLEALTQQRYAEKIQIKETEAARLRNLVSEQEEVAVKDQAAYVQSLYNAGLYEEAAAAAASVPALTEKEGRYKAQLFLVESQIEALGRLRDAEAARPALKASADAWKKFTDDIERSLTDSLYRAFESGESFGAAFAKSLQNTIKTAALKLTVQVVVGTGGNLVAQAADSVLGTKFSSSGSSLLGTASNVNSLYNAFSGGGVLGSLAGSSAAYGAAIGTTSIGAGSQAAMLAAQTGAFGVEGAAATAAAAGTISSEAAAAASGLASAASWALPAIGALAFVATNFKKIVGGQKSMGDGVQIVGSFGEGGFSGMMGQDWQKSGGWFGKKKNGVDWSPLNPEIDKAFDDLYTGVKTGLIDLGKRFGDDSVAGVLDGFSMQVDQRSFIQVLSLTAEQIGTDLVKSMLSQVAPVVNDVMARTGSKDWAGTLNTMTAQAEGVGNVLKLIGRSLTDDFPWAKLNDILWLTDNLVQSFGGLDTLSSAVGTYYQDFYSAEERNATALAQMTEQVTAAGLAMPKTKDEFRSLVDSLDLATDSGRQAFVTLMKIAPAFSTVTEAMEQTRTAAQEQARAVAAARQGWQNKLDVLTGVTTDRQLQLQADLASTTDATTQALIRQVYAQEDLNSVAQQRANLENQILQLQGNTNALRAQELAALDESNRALQEQIYALQDAAAVAQERTNLENQLLQMQGNTTELRARELAALDPSNRALQEQIYALEDAKTAAEEAKTAADALAQAQADAAQRAAEAARAAEAIAQERLGLEKQLWQLQGDTVKIREKELEALNPANRALQEQIWLLQDQAEAAQRLAQIESERMGLQRQLWQLQGNTAAIRRAELEALDPSNRALQEQIWALEDSKKAADEWISTWENLSSSLLEQAKKLRGEISAQSSSSLMAQFATATAQARAGDSTAAGQLVGLSDQLMEAYNNTAGSSLEVARMAAYLAGSLETTANMTTALSPPTYRGTVKTNDNYSGSRQQAETTDEVRQLREENRSQAAAISRLLTELTRITSRWDRDGMPEIRAEAL